MKQKKATILLVDDETMILEMYGVKLKENGYEVLTAQSAAEGL